MGKMRFWKAVNEYMRSHGYVYDEHGTYDCNKCGTQAVRYVQYIKSLGRPFHLPPPEDYKPGAKRWTLLGTEVLVACCHNCGALASSNESIEAEIAPLLPCQTVRP